MGKKGNGRKFACTCYYRQSSSSTAGYHRHRYRNVRRNGLLRWLDFDGISLQISSTENLHIRLTLRIAGSNIDVGRYQKGPRYQVVIQSTHMGGLHGVWSWPGVSGRGGSCKRREWKELQHPGFARGDFLTEFAMLFCCFESERKKRE